LQQADRGVWQNKERVSNILILSEISRSDGITVTKDPSAIMRQSGLKKECEEISNSAPIAAKLPNATSEMPITKVICDESNNGVAAIVRAIEGVGTSEPSFTEDGSINSRLRECK